MSEKVTRIFFLTWPDGKVFEGTQTSVNEDIAIGKALRTWLHPENFPSLDLGSRYHGPMEGLWRAMQRAGFKVQSIELTDATGVSY